MDNPLATSPKLCDKTMAKIREKLDEDAKELGFQQLGVSGFDLRAASNSLKQWLKAGYQGEMRYMQEHTELRENPAILHAGSVRAISVRMDYMNDIAFAPTQLKDKSKAYISRYALGRDYHKLIRKRLTTLAKKLDKNLKQLGFHELGYRAFTDSAPIFERALAEKAGLGWVGKNCMLINRKAGSYFFLGEILTNLPLPINTKIETNHCGSCRSCFDICPTNAFVGDKILDARRCISYLTIELKSAIPKELRRPMGNRVFGCDDCQLACPWNRFSKPTQEADFSPRHNLDKANLLELYAWCEQEFLEKTAGMPIRRTGYANFKRNLAVALGNAPYSLEISEKLLHSKGQISPLVDEHIEWALQEQAQKRGRLKPNLGE